MFSLAAKVRKLDARFVTFCLVLRGLWVWISPEGQNFFLNFLVLKFSGQKIILIASCGLHLFDLAFLDSSLILKLRSFVTVKCPLAQFPYTKWMNIVRCFISSISVQYLFTLFRYKIIIYSTIPHLFSSYICIKKFTSKSSFKCDKGLLWASIKLQKQRCISPQCWK